MKRLQGYKYYLENYENAEMREIFSAYSLKAQACKEQGLNEKEWKVVRKEMVWTERGFQKNLTKAQLLKILANFQDDDEIKVDVEYNLWDYSNQVLQMSIDDGLCYDEENNSFHIFAGDFEC